MGLDGRPEREEPEKVSNQRVVPRKGRKLKYYDYIIYCDDVKSKFSYGTELAYETLTRMAQVLKLLAHPHRLKVIDILEGEDKAPVHALVKRLGVPQGAKSQHLNQMRRVGLISAERRGKKAWYRIADRRSLTILNCIREKGGT